MCPAKVRFKELAESYGPPVDKLLTLGAIEEKHRLDPWPDYLAHGLGDAQVPDLIRMATDLRFDRLSHRKAATWAPLHAWRALGQLQAVAAAEPLLRLSAVSEDEMWFPRELPHVLAMIGPAAIPAIAVHFADESLDEFNRATGPECLARMALEHPEARGDCLEILTRHLGRFEQGGRDLNAFVVSALIDLNATEAIELVREAFAKEAVDLMMCGDIEDVEIAMGLRSERATPPLELRPFAGLPGSDPLTSARQQLAMMPVERPVKIGRNDPCPCGSGKKYKKCCLEHDHR